MKRVILFAFLLGILKTGLCQPRYEFRAVWVATVANIDWPSKPGLSTEEQQKEIIDILDMHHGLGMNAVILQIRPASDAFYPSALEPWSRYLTGIPGKAPEPFYDPLAFWIKESHARGMELHAWLNPYRVAQKYDAPLAANHIAFKHPDWILKYGDRLYFDPGIPEAKDFVIQVVRDIVQRYDVDAIHFDDYFYPYPLADEFPDTVSFAKFNRGFGIEDKADWRRENVDIIIKQLNDTIKSVKPWVKFGISPFGVWRNIEDDPAGSNTKAGATNYDHLYADIIKWQKNGWVDYTLPQLYWHIGHPLVDFEHLAHWWKNHTYNRAMYIGHAPYKIDKSSETEQWTSAQELVKQIKLLRDIPEIEGSAYFSSKHFSRKLFGFQDSLQKKLYNKPAIIPPMKWIDNTKPAPVSKIRKSGKKVKWKVQETSDEMDKPNLFVVYLYEKGIEFDENNAAQVKAIKKGNSHRFERMNKKRKKYEVRVSVLDRLSNESKISESVTIRL